MAEVERVGVDVLYVLTGRREAPLAAGYHEESSEGIDAVLDRMFEAVGKPFGFGYAKAFDVSERTLSAWRARGQVARRYLEGFAREYGKSLDWLLHGDEQRQASENMRPYGLSDDENALLERYRRSTPDVRAAALRMLSEPTEPPPLLRPPRRLTELPSDLSGRRFKKPTPRGGA